MKGGKERMIIPDRPGIIPRSKGVRFVPITLLPEDQQAQLSVNPAAPKVIRRGEEELRVEDATHLFWGDPDKRFLIERVLMVRDSDQGTEVIRDTCVRVEPLAALIALMRTTPSGEREFFLIRQQRPALPTPILDFPQGHIRKTERFTAAIARETREETGFTIKGASLEILAVKPRDVVDSRSFVFYVLVEQRGRARGRELEEGEEISGGVWKPLSWLWSNRTKLSDTRATFLIDCLKEFYER